MYKCRGLALTLTRGCRRGIAIVTVSVSVSEVLDVTDVKCDTADTLSLSL